MQLDAPEYLYIRLSVAFAGLRRLLPLVLHSSAVESGVGGGGRHMRWWQSHAAAGGAGSGIDAAGSAGQQRRAAPMSASIVFTQPVRMCCRGVNSVGEVW